MRDTSRGAKEKPGRQGKWTTGWAAAVLVGSLLIPLGAAAAAPEPGTTETIVDFDGSALELPESLTIDKQGNIYVSFALTGEVRKIAPDGTQTTLAVLDRGSNGFLAGLKVDGTGRVYAAVASFESDTHGVWRIDPHGSAERIAAFPTSALPNDLAFDDRGRIYVTDSIGGAIWRVTGTHSEVWAADELLRGRRIEGDPLPFPVGANGIAFSPDGVLYVANTTFSRIVQIPIEPDGTAGTPETYVEAELLGGPDGIALDIARNIYVTNALGGGVFVVTPDRSIDTLVDSTTVDDPSSVAFGTVGGDQKSLFVTNFSFFTRDNPFLLRVFVGVPGRPLH